MTYNICNKIKIVLYKANKYRNKNAKLLHSHHLKMKVQK